MIEQLRKIIPAVGETKAGWIFPSGEIVPCAVMDHRSVLPQRYRVRYDELLENYNQSMYQDLSELGEDEHPAMHRFDPEGHSWDELLNELATDGFIRFGIYNDRKKDRVTIELWSIKATVDRHHDVIQHIVDATGAETVQLANVHDYYHSRSPLKEFTR